MSRIAVLSVATFAALLPIAMRAAGADATSATMSIAAPAAVRADASSSSSTDGLPLTLAASDSESPRLQYGGTIGPRTAPSGCRTPVVRSALPAREVQRLGTHAVGETVPFRVPPFTGTISIIEQAVGTPPRSILFGQPPYAFAIPNAAVPTLLTAPDGTVFYDDNAAVPTDRTGQHAIADPTAATGVITLPSTTQALRDSGQTGYPPGTWSVQINDYALECLAYGALCTGGTDTDQYDLTVITTPIARRTGALHVSVYLASETQNGRDALASPGMRRFARTLAALYRQAGIGIDDVTIYDLPPWAKALYATGVDAGDTGPCSEFGQLLTLSNHANEIPFFFVDAIQYGGNGGLQIVGIDGGIPGPASLGGTVISGAIVNASDLGAGTCGQTPDYGNCGADLTAYVAAHEGGHYMGLYHTTEAYGDAFDPLSDTPVCTCNACLDAARAALCVNYQWYKTADTCTQSSGSPCGGGDNLMFWLVQPPISTGALLPEQGRVMRANPVVGSGD